jgi:hypothetical protein
MYRSALLNLAFVALSSIGGRATDLPMDRATLHGLEALNVVVDIPVEVESAGITRAKLTSQIKQGLMAKEIKIDTNSIDFLGLRVTLAHEKRSFYAVSVSLAVYQNVTLARDPKIKTTTETWSVDSVLLSPPKLLETAVSSTVNDLLLQFVNAYQAGKR